MFNLEELSLEFVEISELKTSKNLFGPVMYGTGVRMEFVEKTCSM